MRWFPVVLVLALASCGTSDAPAAPPMSDGYRQAVRDICNAPLSAGFPAGTQELGMWLDANVTDPDGKALLRAIAAADSADKAPMLRAAARRAGLDRCEFAEQIAARVQQPL